MVKLELGYRIDAIQITEENRFDVLAEVRPFHDQLRFAKGREERELYDNVSPGNEAVIIKTDEHEPRNVAVMVEKYKVINIGGEKYGVLMRLLRATILSGHNFAQALTDEPIERLKPDAITGRTQNPIIPATDVKSTYIREENMYPWGRFYTPDARELLVAALAGEGNSLAEAHRVTGVCRRIYPEGETRLFDSKRLKGNALRFYQRMIADYPEGLGAKLEEGDGVRYIIFPDLSKRVRGRSRFAAEKTALESQQGITPMSRISLVAT